MRMAAAGMTRGLLEVFGGDASALDHSEEVERGVAY
jgi:hypothetical protein